MHLEYNSIEISKKTATRTDLTEQGRGKDGNI